MVREAEQRVRAETLREAANAIRSIWRECGGSVSPTYIIDELRRRAFRAERSGQGPRAEGAAEPRDRLREAAREILDELEDRYDGAPDSDTLWMGAHINRLGEALKEAQ